MSSPEPNKISNTPRVKGITLPVKKMSRVREEVGRLLFPESDDDEHPKVREECDNGDRPCPWVSCKYHLYLDVNPETGSIKFNFPDREVWELEETCALDVAERGGITLEEVAEVMNLTRERIRQLEMSGLRRLSESTTLAACYYNDKDIDDSKESKNKKEKKRRKKNKKKKERNQESPISKKALRVLDGDLRDVFDQNTAYSLKKDSDKDDPLEVGFFEINL